MIARRSEKTGEWKIFTAMGTKDQWTQQAYQASASFVPLLAGKVVSWLDVQPHDRIIDLGCGDGILTRKFASGGAKVLGLDSSSNLIQAARDADCNESVEWHVQDCRNLANLEVGAWDKVFSNAALHWILSDPASSREVFSHIHRALRQNGTFVFEMGGAGNVAEVYTALISAVVHQGVSVSRARAASPWFFPSERLISSLLQDSGFDVEKIELEYRPTRLTQEESGGLRGWVELMGASFLDLLEDDLVRKAAVQEVCDVLYSILRHEEDDSIWLGYVRLRVAARKI